MKTKIAWALISLFTIFPVKAQNSSKKAQLEKKIAELEKILGELADGDDTGKESSAPEVINSVCYSKTLYTNLSPLSNKQFLDYCKEEISKLKQQSNLPSNIDDQIITSCYQDKGVINASFCVISNPNAKPKLVEVGDLARQKQMREKVLTKIRNTKKMYQDMITALNKEVAANNIEIAESASDLALKHLDMEELEPYRPIIEEGKDQAIDALKEKYGLGGRASTKNEVADALNEGIDFAEEVASVIPGGDKVTCHYLWRIFKSTPEVGKMIGNGAAAITIMFQRREYENKLKELDKWEKELLRN